MEQVTLSDSDISTPDSDRKLAGYDLPGSLLDTSKEKSHGGATLSRSKLIGA